MEQKQSFLKMVCNLAIPVALQSMLQSSFSIVDQIMIGQLGSVSVAAVGFAGKFSSIYSVVVAAIGAVAGIMISQYMGQNNKKEIKRSFYLNLLISLGLAIVFTGICILLPEKIMGLYTKDAQTITASAEYLKFIAGTFLPIAGATLLSTLFRCMEKAQLPLYASIAAAVLNTGLNYILIFGKFGFPLMGAKGAAIATLISQLANFSIMLVMLFKHNEFLKKNQEEEITSEFYWKQYVAMLFPILICEFMWSLGENVYSGIYGNIGTKDCAAMTMTSPIQCLMMGALCGLSQAAGIMVGKSLGRQDYDKAYKDSKRLMKWGFAASILLSVLLILLGRIYTGIYNVEPDVKQTAYALLVAFAIVSPVKVQNMILGGGIIRSGGKTKYLMIIDIVGTWGFGVPLGLISAFVFKLPITYVYFILSMEECVRLGISWVVFRRKRWMQKI